MFYGTEILESLNLLSSFIDEHTVLRNIDALTVEVVSVVGLVINFIQSIIKGSISLFNSLPDILAHFHQFLVVMLERIALVVENHCYTSLLVVWFPFRQTLDIRVACFDES